MLRYKVWSDVMQVCVNGHRITQYAKSEPATRRNFCKDCGEPTIDACGACGSPIGATHDSRFAASHSVPKYCSGCGSAYPWQVSALENVMEIVNESDLSEQDKQDMERALPDVLRETAKTESASLK